MQLTTVYQNTMTLDLVSVAEGIFLHWCFIGFFPHQTSSHGRDILHNLFMWTCQEQRVLVLPQGVLMVRRGGAHAVLPCDI